MTRPVGTRGVVTQLHAIKNDTGVTYMQTGPLAVTTGVHAMLRSRTGNGSTFPALTLSVCVTVSYPAAQTLIA